MELGGSGLGTRQDLGAVHGKPGRRGEQRAEARGVLVEIVAIAGVGVDRADDGLVRQHHR